MRGKSLAGSSIVLYFLLLTSYASLKKIGLEFVGSSPEEGRKYEFGFAGECIGDRLTLKLVYRAGYYKILTREMNGLIRQGCSSRG